MSGLERARERGKSAENSNTAIDNMDAPLNVNGAGEMFLQWPCLSCENINVLMELSVDQVQLQLADVLDLKKHQTCVKEASVLDYFVAGFWWAKEMTFTCQQISFIMSLLQLLIDNINGKYVAGVGRYVHYMAKDKHMPFADNFKEFTRTLLSTRRSSPSASATVNPLFDVDQIKSITDYFSSSLFQHYRLYEFLFTHPRDDMLLGMERNVEVVDSAVFVAPLEEGTPTDDLHHIGPAPVAPPDQDSDACAERDEEESDEREQVETLESLEGFSVGDVREVLEEMTREMLGKLQEDFTEKLRIQEETYTARLESLKRRTTK